MVENTRKDKIFNWIIYIVMGIYAFVTLLPLLHVLANSFSAPEAVYRGKVGLWPVDFSFTGIKKVFKNESIVRGYLNTLMYTGIGTVIQLVLQFTCAYPLARRDLKGKSVVNIYLALTTIYVFIPNNTYTMVCYRFNENYAIYWDAFYQCGYIILRLILMVSLTMVLTASTKPMDLTYAFEWYMYPLKLIRFPVHEIAMTLSIALRFIPTLLDETDRIMKAQSSRGVDFYHGLFFKRFRAIISLIIPLFVSAIQRSEELSDAMEARGYNPRAKRTRYRKLMFSWRDIIAFLLIGAMFGGVLYLFIVDRTQEPLNLFMTLFKINVGF